MSDAHRDSSGSGPASASSGASGVDHFLGNELGRPGFSAAVEPVLRITPGTGETIGFETSDAVYAELHDHHDLAQLSVPQESEATFNDFYDNHYLPQLLKLPGVNAVSRYKLEWTDGEKAPEYLAIYEVDGPEVPRSKAWLDASISSGWASTIRPLLTVRRHAMFRRLP